MKIFLKNFRPSHNIIPVDLNSLLVTGSRDATLFVFQIKIFDKYPNLIPIGFIKLPSGATCMTWKPQAVSFGII